MQFVINFILITVNPNTHDNTTICQLRNFVLAYILSRYLYKSLLMVYGRAESESVETIHTLPMIHLSL